MITKTIKTRKINHEIYTFILNYPEYIGEKGILGIELTPYITIQTPVNCFGYDDTLLYDAQSENLYTLNRGIQAWIKKELLNTYRILEKKYLSMEARQKYYDEIKDNKPLWDAWRAGK